MPSKAALNAHAAARSQKAADEELLKKASKYVENKVIKMFSNSHLIKLENVECLPTFERKELTYGKVLGRGGYGIVNEITAIDAPLDIVNKREEGKKLSENFEDRAFISGNYKLKGSGDARYVVKSLNHQCKTNAGLYIQGIMDLAVETYFLASICHPNIIKMRAIRTGSMYHKDFFLVFERLYDTLERRIEKWAKMNKRKNSVFGNKKKVENLFYEQIFCATEISEAVAYLHSHRIIYRDLKPENIGFDGNDKIKIFDFGLAKQLHPDEEMVDGTYDLSGETGSMRYMAPEVSKSQKYNLSVDVYSFSIMLWEMLAMEKPFKEYSTTMHKDLVINKGYRPKCDEKWSEALRNLLKTSWDGNWSKRPVFVEVNNILKNEVPQEHMGNTG